VAPLPKIEGASLWHCGGKALLCCLQHALQKRLAQ
jgi:hypothetical protein